MCRPSFELQPGYLILGEPDVACSLIVSLEAGRRKKKAAQTK